MGGVRLRRCEHVGAIRICTYVYEAVSLWLSCERGVLRGWFIAV